LIGETRRFRWKQITAIIEPTRHDNGADDADQADDKGDSLVYDHRPAISITDAIAWATAIPEDVTLYLYDLGSGI
jgi:hypothetical protein